jgi:hypothetical protein
MADASDYREHHSYDEDSYAPPSRSEILARIRRLFAIGEVAVARRIWDEWKHSTETVYAPVDAEREHRDKMAF